MEKVSVAKLKDNLSRYLEYVRRGGRLIVYRRDEPVAEIGPPQGPGGEGVERDRLRNLERQGIVRVGSGILPDELREPPSGDPAGALEALLEERASGR